MSKPQPKRKSDIVVARAFFYAADYDACLRCLDDAPQSAESDFIRARTLLRRHQFVEVVRLLANRNTGRSKRDSIEHNLLLGAAYGLTKDFDQGLRLIEPALKNEDSDLRADGLYYTGLIHWMRFDNAAAQTFAESLLGSADANNRARANTLLSWIAVRRHEMAGTAKYLTLALDEAETATPRDIGILANALFALAVLCREVPLPELADRVREVAAAMPWTADLATQQFHVTRALGWIDALNGDYLGAFRQLRTASQIAPSAPWRIVSLLDRASLARSTGETAFALDQLREASDLASSVQWARTQGEERTTLLILADLSASVDPAAATTYLSEFRSLQTPVTPNLTYESDPRARAFEAYSTGLVYAQLGDREQGKKLLIDAWNIFDAFRYDWRSALTAHHLHSITGDDLWRYNAAHKISSYPRSWIARMIGENNRVPLRREDLTATQLRVFNLLAEGRSTNAIAKELNRSPNTVRNHLRDIYQILNVRGRAELLAKIR